MGEYNNQALPKAAQSARGNGLTKKDLMRELKNRTQTMDLSGPISFKSIADALNTTPVAVQEICKKHSISIQQYAMKRKFYVEKNIIDFMKTINNKPMTIKDAFNLFSAQYKHKISYVKFGLMLKYNNLMGAISKTPDNIFSAFNSFIRAEHTNSNQNMETLIENGRINDLLDKFINYYGEHWGFETSMAKDMMTRFLMTKIQIRDKTIRNQELGQFFNQTGVASQKNKKLFSLIEQGMEPRDISKETGIDINQIKHFYDIYKNKQEPIVNDSHPSYFLTREKQKQDNNPPQLASNKMNWYKKSNKWKDSIPGGKADEKKPSDFNKRSVEKGKKIEYEHTNDPSLAREIAIDHLEEHEDYYDEKKGLPAMEKKLERKKPARRGRYNGGPQIVNF